MLNTEMNTVTKQSPKTHSNSHKHQTKSGRHKTFGYLVAGRVAAVEAPSESIPPDGDDIQVRIFDNRTIDSLISAALISLFALNGFLFYPLVYGGFLASVYPSWTAPKPVSPLPAVIKVQMPNVLDMMIERINEFGYKLIKICLDSNGVVNQLCITDTSQSNLQSNQSINTSSLKTTCKPNIRSKLKYQT